MINHEIMVREIFIKKLENTLNRNIFEGIVASLLKKDLLGYYFLDFRY
jgi:hypothetical protein